VVCTLWTAPLHAGTLDFQAFNDRQHYSAVLLQQGRVQLDADWNEETAGPIKQGQLFKIFSFSFDPHVVLPVVGSGWPWAPSPREGWAATRASRFT
jgi:hypothetical protein